jgi:hypothetical protein
MPETNHTDVDIIEDDDPTEELQILSGHLADPDEDPSVAKTNSAANQPFEDGDLDAELRDAADKISYLSSELRSRTESMKSIQRELDELKGFSEFLAKEVESGRDVVSSVTDELVLVRTQQNDFSEQLRRRNQQIAALRDKIARKDALIDEFARQADTTGAIDEKTCLDSQHLDGSRRAETQRHPADHNEQVQPDRLRMIVARHDGKALRYPIPPGGLSIGTSSDNDVQLHAAFVSYRHARITETAAGCVLKDLGSSNGTWINQRRVKWQVLRDGDLFDIGPLRFEFIDKPVETEEEQTMDGADE